MRRLLVVNALIFAVLAAAVALAYYGFTGKAETSRERELALMQDLAEEKVLNIESLIVEADNKLLRRVKLAEIVELPNLPSVTGTAVLSIYVLDAQFKLVPGGFVSSRKDRGEGIALRDWFLDKVVPELPLADAKVDTRGHKHFDFNRGPFLFAFMKRVETGQTFYVVIENNVTEYLMVQLFPQFFTISNKRLYQVFNEHDVSIYGEPFAAGGLVVEQRFLETVDRWVLRVAQKDPPNPVDRKALFDSILIGCAVVVIVGGLAVLGFGIRRERRLSDLKSEFISNVSHELKTPLSIISMFGEMLANGRTKNPEQAHEYAEIIWRESVRLGRLIDNVLDFAKIERGMGVYEFADDADVGEVVDRAVELSGRRVAAADMTLEVELEPDLPRVRLDGNAFTLAVLNLIDNAIKYAVDGKKIALSLKQQADRVVLAVRDWGPGIDPEEQDRIFERFYRAKAVRLKPIRGSGIGLALVQHIARAHGGDVEVASTPEGSTFSIWLPVDA